MSSDFYSGFYPAAAGTTSAAWWVPALADALQGDPNTLLQSAITEGAGGAKTFSVSGGAGYTNPLNGASLSWPLQDLFGNVLASFPVQLHVGIKVTLAATPSSGVVIAAGVIDGPDIATNKLYWMKIDFDGASPRTGVGEDGSQSNGAANAAIVGAVLDFEIPPSLTTANRRRVADARSGPYDSSNVGVNATSSRALNNDMINAPRFFVSVYGSGAIAGTETVTVTPYALATPFPGSWTP